MRSRVHDLDVSYAFLSDQEIEAIWRDPRHGDPEFDEAILRQVVLRSAPVIELAVIAEATTHGFTLGEIDRASDEVALRLYVRLRGDRRVRSVRAAAHAIALQVVRDPSRRRDQACLLFAPRTPRLRLLTEDER